MAAPPVIQVAGRKNAGKTHLLTHLVTSLTARGYRIAAFRHIPHAKPLDLPQRDLCRYADAGAASSALCSPEDTILFLPQLPSETVYKLSDCLGFHLILIEGELSGNFDRIEVISPGCSPLCGADSRLKAIVADRAGDSGPPCFARHDIQGLALFIESQYLKQSISAAVLAGGRSRRLGTDKALVKLGEKPLLQRTLEMLKPRIGSVRIVGRTDDDVTVPGIPICADILPGGGPLSGIHAALVNAGTEYVLVCSCDMPLITPETIQKLLLAYPGYDITLFKHRFFEPLCAVYRRSCIPALEDLIAHREYRIIDLFPTLSVQVLRTDNHEIFKSINTPEDYQYVLERFRG